MSNALKDGLVAHYPLQSNAVNMVDGVAGTINGTASWVKNHAGKVVLDDTTASITHNAHATDTVTYWKDGHFYAVLNGVPYMIDEELNSSFVNYATSTNIGGKQADIAYKMVTGATVPNIGTGGSSYDLTLLNSPTFTTVTYAGRSVNVWEGDWVNKALQTTGAVANMAASPFIFSGVIARGASVAGYYPVIYSQRTTHTDAENTNQIYTSLSTTSESSCFFKKTSGDETSSHCTAPGVGVPSVFIGGLGSDKKAWLCIDGNCSIASTAISNFYTQTKILTIGGYADLPSISMFNGKSGEMAWWKNVSGTAAELAAKAVIRNTDYAAGRITSDNFMLWGDL